MTSVDAAYLADVRVQFQKVKKLCDDALAQVRDEELTVTLDPEANSLAVLMRHMAGNLRSRFTDFLTTDGEKPDRNRDAEFESPGDQSRAALMAHWEAGWESLFQTLTALKPDDLMREVAIRSERVSVVQALDRALVHQAQHAGQIVMLAKHLRSTDWRSLSIPRWRGIPDH